MNLIDFLCSIKAPHLLLLFAASLNLAWLMVERRARLKQRSPSSLVNDVKALGETQKLTSSFQKLHFEWQDISLKALSWLRIHREAAIAGSLILGIALYFWVFSPPRPALMLPGQEKPPFQQIHPIRVFIELNRNLWAFLLTFLAFPLSFSLLLAAIMRRNLALERSFAASGLLVAALGLAGLGQLALIGYYNSMPGLMLYLEATFLFLLWAFNSRSQLEFDLFTTTWPRGLELSLLALTMLLTIFARFYLIEWLPYGIEGDESKWTIQTVSAMIDGQYPIMANHYLRFTPLSFYMQAPFHHLFGAGLLSARLTVATYSVLGSLLFYWLARQITNAQTAWLATTLLAVSLLDVNASRMANVESHVKFWPLLTLGLLLKSTQNGRLLTYALAGGAVVAGMLTYDTVDPLALIGLLIILYELLRSKIDFFAGLQRLTAYLAPILVATPIILAYLQDRFRQYTVHAAGSEGAEKALWERWGMNFQEVFYCLFVQNNGDFLLNRKGPMFNSLLLPWLVLGTVFALVNWRKSKFLWIILFGLLYFFPAPVLTHTPFARVFYPGLPAAYLLMALGMVAAFGALSRAVGPQLQPIWKTLAFIGLFFIIIFNQYLSFNEIIDNPDRRDRRELYELAQAAAGPTTMVYFPYIPEAGDLLESEKPHVIWFGMRKKATKSGERYPYEVIKLQDLLPSLSSLAGLYDKVELIWPHNTDALHPARGQVLAALQRCYPLFHKIEGQSFDRYVLPGAALAAPRCTSGNLVLEPKTVEVNLEQPVKLQWKFSGTALTSLTFTCATLVSNTLALAAEDFKGEGWSDIARFVTAFEGRGFLTDSYGSQNTSLAVDLPEKGPWYIWLRSYRRVQDPFPGFVTLEERPLPFSQGKTVPLNMWVWQRVGPFKVTKKQTNITLARPYAGDQAAFRALFVDSLILTVSPTFNPNINAAWEEKVQQNLENNEPEGSLSYNLAPGDYRCWVRGTEKQKLVDGLGNEGLKSNEVQVLVKAKP